MTTSTTSVNHYFHYRRENDYFHYGPCTTTSFVELDPLQNARFKGITAENDRRGPNACVE